MHTEWVQLIQYSPGVLLVLIYTATLVLPFREQFFMGVFLHYMRLTCNFYKRKAGINENSQGNSNAFTKKV